MNKKISATVVIAIIMGLSAWSPWLGQGRAEALALRSFNDSWEGVVDGCGTQCPGCGPVSSRSVPFGRVVTIEYACGLIPADAPEYHQRARAFVSAVGTVHGLEKP